MENYYYNSDDIIFNFGFGIGLVKYILSEYKIEDEIPQPFGAVSYGLFNGIRTSIIASFVPSKLRIIVPVIDITCLFIRIINKKRKKNKSNQVHCIYDIEKQHKHTD
jgi:hypothetical protein